MKVYKLSFGSVIILAPNLAEVIINEGVIIDELNVDEYHDFLLTNLDAPFSLLVNKKHSYTYRKTKGNKEHGSCNFYNGSFNVYRNAYAY